MFSTFVFVWATREKYILLSFEYPIFVQNVAPIFYLFREHVLSQKIGRAATAKVQYMHSQTH